MTGTGKTTTVMKLLYEWGIIGKSAIVFDWKGDYLSLYPALKEIYGEKLINYFWAFNLCKDEFRFNPLRIPSEEGRFLVKPIVWIEAFIDAFVHSFSLREPSASILLICLLQLYPEHGIDPYNKTSESYEFPKLNELMESVEEYKPLSNYDRESQRSILVRLRLLTEGILGSVFDDRAGVELEELLNHFVIFNLKDVPLVANKKFFIECFYGLTYEYAKAKDDRSKTKCIPVIEEAHNILSKNKSSFDLDIVTKPEICLAELRDFGYGINNS